MINYTKFTLANGLRVLVHEDHASPLVAVNMLYNVGSRDENPERTGFAHLFEHLMFGGSKNVKDFDTVIQNAGGESNAYTNTDITNFYCTLPAENLEIAFWVESDRMLLLNVNQKSLNVQKKVVVEEFKETVLNEPYGDVWHHLSEMAYKVHPYNWAVIGKKVEHIKEASLEEVSDFYKAHYCPNNAILTVAGKVDTMEVRALIQKWFGDIPEGNTPIRNLPQEPKQTQTERQTVTAAVPVPALYMAFRSVGRTDADYYAIDLLTDVLSSGNSSRFYRNLLKEQRLVTEIDCYQTGSIDPGLLMIEFKPSEGIAIETVEKAIWGELERLKTELISADELQKLKNKVESQTAFSDTSVFSKASNLAYYELIGDANLINTEIEAFENVTVTDIHRVANDLFRPENMSVLVYLPKN